MAARILASDQLWVVGWYEDPEFGGEWVFAGIFSTEQLAIEQCLDDTYFIAPALLDQSPDEDNEEWVGLYHPLAH